MPPFRDLREFVQILEARGKLYRFTDPVNKETELCALLRVQDRGVADEERKVLLFDKVHGAKGSKYAMPVLAGVYGASEAVLALGLRCETYQEALERWHRGLVNPIEPVLVEDGPVHENVMTGEELKKVGLDIFPVPVEEPGFSGMLRTGVPMITKDPETGVRNVGTYNGFLKARDRMQAAIGPGAHAMVHHWAKARERGEGLPVAIVIGCDPALMVAGSAAVPYGVDELAVAGGVMGEPAELVRCRTIPLEVPARAEAVIEGIMSTETVEPRLPFGEYPGYIHSDMTVRPLFQVTAITYRHDAMFTPVLVGFMPSDTSVVYGFAHAGQLYHRLKYERGFPVEEVYFPDLGGGSTFSIVRMAEDATPEDAQGVVKDLEERRGGGKYSVVVDSDINVRDADLLIWALTFRTARRGDFVFAPSGGGGLDPSGAPPGTGRGRMSAFGDRDYVRVIINATRKWPYPPVALPKKEYMERAVEIWGRHPDLPRPKLREPWYGYTLGYWNEQLQHYADLIVQGEYLRLGEEMGEFHETVRDDMMRLTLRTAE